MIEGGREGGRGMGFSDKRCADQSVEEGSGRSGIERWRVRGRESWGGRDWRRDKLQHRKRLKCMNLNIKSGVFTLLQKEQ